MFEKEAEEYGNSFEWTNDDRVIDYSKQAFQKGAEYGYSKANEWHYVKDGDLPKDQTKKIYLVALKSEQGYFFYETDIWCASLHCFSSKYPTKVYAWQELTLVT